jgi:hypothetical protein
VQAFQFAKELMLLVRAHKQQRLKDGEVAASNADPLTLAVDANISYDESQKPLREISLTCSCGEGDDKAERSYVLTVPEGALLRREEDIEIWLASVFEFVANAHGMALRRVAEKGDNQQPETRVFINPNEWQVKWQIKDGALSALPVEAAAQQLDKMAKQALDGWRQSTSDERYVVRRIKDIRQAEETKELLHLLLEISGHSDEELRSDIKIKPAREGIALKMPKRHLELIHKSEQYLGY